MDNILAQLRNQDKIQLRDEPEAKPTKVPLASASAANAVSLDRLNSSAAASPKARTGSGTFKSKKASVPTNTITTIKYKSYRLLLVPDIKSIILSEGYTKDLFSQELFNNLDDKNYLKSVDVSLARRDFGIALCEKAGSVFREKFKKMDGETTPEFVVLRIVGGGKTGRTPFRGKISLRVAEYDIPRKLADITNAGDAESLTVKPRAVLGFTDVIVIARPARAATPWPESRWNKDEEDDFDDGMVTDREEDGREAYQVKGDFELRFDDRDVDPADVGALLGSRDLDYFIDCIYQLFPKKTTRGAFPFDNKALLAVAGGDRGVKMLARHLITSYEYNTKFGILHSHIKKVLQHLESLVTINRSFLSDMDWLPSSAGQLALEIERARQPDGGYNWKEGRKVEHALQEHPSIERQSALLLEVRKEVNQSLEFSNRTKVENLIRKITDIAAEDGYLIFAIRVLDFAKWFFVDGDLAPDFTVEGEHPGFRDLVFELCRSTQYNLNVHFAVYDVPELEYPGCSPFFMTPDYYEAEKDSKSKGKGKKFVFWGSVEEERGVLRKEDKGKGRSAGDGQAADVVPAGDRGHVEEDREDHRSPMETGVAVSAPGSASNEGMKRKTSDPGSGRVSRSRAANSLQP
ncbi:hypothetical protein P7C70_g6058, partial [Phenoliferia sp. Uapishka_3]